MRRIKNLKYDPKHADKKQRAYAHLEYLDRVFTLEKASKIIEYEKKNYGKPVTMEIVETTPLIKKKTDKVEKNANE